MFPTTCTSNLSASTLQDAASSLISGRLVAFPTETVYGLGADACNKQAVSRVYKVKGRPIDHPLIIHVSSINLISKWAREIPDYAMKLAKNFWPGPLTLILPKSNIAQNFITGGQNSVGIRVPNHPIAIELLSRFESLGGLGVAAPSANRFGAVSPTNSAAVEKELGKFLSAEDLIIDGGNSEIGIESTIINCLEKIPQILRPGAITPETVRETLDLDLIFDWKNVEKIKIMTSGLRESHYSPAAKVFLTGTPNFGDGFIALNSHTTPEGVIRLAAPRTNEEYAHTLYDAFRMADAKGIGRVYAIPPIGSGIAIAICDRLTKAANRK